jgi:metallo-beta-lactamase family protein
VRILGAYRELHAQVEVVEAFSAHADRDELLSYARQCGPQVRGFFVVHGELAEAEALAEGLRATGHTVAIPEAGEQVTLD